MIGLANICGSGLREVTLPGAAHPAGDPGNWPGSCPGGQNGYGAIFAITVWAALGAIAVQADS